MQTGMDSAQRDDLSGGGIELNELLDGTEIVRAINHEVLGNPAIRICRAATSPSPAADNCLHAGDARCARCLRIMI